MAQPVTFKWQSTFATKDFFHDQLVDVSKKVEETSQGRIKVDVLVSGSVVGAFQLQDAVHTGTLDGGLGVPVYWFGKDRAMSLFGTGPSTGLLPDHFLSWIWYGGGQKEYDDLIQKKLKVNVQSFFFGPMPTQPFGWFRKEIRGVEDMKGLKFRTVGLSIDSYQALGSTVLALPGADIVPGLEKGVIDAAEFNNTTSDLLLGFPDVSKNFYVQSWHQPNEFLELLVSKTKYDALPKELQRAIINAVKAQSADFVWTIIERNSKDYQEILRRGVAIRVTPKSILDAQLKAWVTIAEKESKDNPDFARIWKLQQDWAKRVGVWYYTIMNDYKGGFDTVFPGVLKT